MENKVLVEISARHVHLSKEDLETLFGKGYELTVKKELSQPGQFASNERVRVIGSKANSLLYQSSAHAEKKHRLNFHLPMHAQSVLTHP